MLRSSYLILLLSTSPLWAQERWQAIAPQLQVTPAYVTAIRDLPFTVGYSLNRDLFPSSEGIIPAGWTLQMEYHPPGGQQAIPQAVPLQWQGQLVFPAGSAAGRGSLESWRIVDDSGTTVRIFSTRVTVEVLGDALVPQAEIHRLSVQEMKQLGVALGDQNLVGVQVSLGIEEDIEEQIAVGLTQEITLIKDTVNGTFTPIAPIPSLYYAVPVSIRFADPPPVGLATSGGISSLPELPFPQRKLPQIDAVIVFPGNIGFLNGFFKPTLILLNVAPEGTPYEFSNLFATIDFPNQAFRLPSLNEKPQFADAKVLGPGPDALAGTADDTNRVKPQQQATASWVLEGLKPGEHEIDFNFRATLLADDGGSYPIRGSAKAFLYIRRPEMDLRFDVPARVEANETFTIDAVFTNTNGVPVNGLCFTIPGEGIRGAQYLGQSIALNGSAVTEVNLANKGDEAIFTLRFRSDISGRVKVAKVDGESTGAGAFNYSINVAVGDPVAPQAQVTLVLPEILNQLDQPPFNFPTSLRSDLRKMAGEALLLSTIPPGSQQDGFQHIPKSAIGKWLERLALTVLRPREGDTELQRRSLALDLYLATLAQADVLVDFLGQNDHYFSWAETLEAVMGAFDTIPTNSLMAPPQTLLFETPAGTTIPLTLTLGERQGYTLKGDTDELVWHHPGGDLSGLFFRGGRWERFELPALAEGSIRLIWNGFEFQILHNESRTFPTWTVTEALPPQFLGVRQIGYETFSDPDQVDPFGRQLLFFFSESVNLNPDFVKQFKIENNFFTHASKLTDQVIKVWARNPLGLIPRSVTYNGSLRSARGPSFASSTHDLVMSPRWNAVPISGQVIAPDGTPAIGATVNLVRFALAKNRARKVEYSDYSGLVAAGYPEIAAEIQAVLDAAGDAYQQTQPGSLVYPVEFSAFIGPDGRYEVDNWPFYETHTWGVIPFLKLPDLQWQVRYGDQVINREIYGRSRGLEVIRDFVFPAQGNFFVHVPPLPDGQVLQPTDVIRVVATDRDEKFVDLIMQPGDRVEVKGLRLGTISILAKAIGSFDAKTILLEPATIGSTVVLNPATTPGTVLAKVRTLDEDGQQVPLKEGSLIIFHYGAVFGGNQGEPALIERIELKNSASGDLSFSLPEGPIDVVYLAKTYKLPWKSISVVPGEVQDLGTLLIEPPSNTRGSVQILVQDDLGNPLPNYRVDLTDQKALSSGRTDENGRILFNDIRMGLGYVQVEDRSGATLREYFTLSEPNQLTTSITFTVSQGFTLTVQAKDEAGLNLPGAWIEASWHRNGNPNERIIRTSGYADATGRFTFQFDQLIPPPNAPIELVVLSPVTFRRGQRIYVRPEGVFQAETEVQIRVTGGLEITVAARDTLELLPDVWVEAQDEAGTVFGGATDANGVLTLLGLGEGPVELSLFPTLGLVQNYQFTSAMASVTAGQVLPFAVFLNPKVEVDPPIIIDVAGQIFDSRNQFLTQAANFKLTATLSRHNGEDVRVPLGSHRTNPDGSFLLEGVAFPAGDWDYMRIEGVAFQDGTGNDGFVSIGCPFRTSGVFVSIQLSEQIDIPVRVWNHLGSRVTVGQVTYTQYKVINQALDTQLVEQTILLSEANFTPNFQVSAGRGYCMTYSGPASSEGDFCERTVSYLHEEGRPTNIVVQATTSFAIRLQDGDDQVLSNTGTILLFKDDRLWEERSFDPDPATGFFTFPDLPTGKWQALAVDLSTGYSNSWYGDLTDEPTQITLKIQRGEDLVGRVIYENGQTVPDAHLSLYRSLDVLDLSLSSVNGRSNQTLLNTSDADGSFLYPGLSRGTYYLNVFDPLTGRTTSSEFTFPQSNDFQIVIPPTGQIRISNFLVTGEPAVGARIRGFNNFNAPVKGVTDGITGEWESGFLAKGAWTFEVESLDGSQWTVFTAEVKTNQLTEVTSKLAVPEYLPQIGFKWIETNDYIDERIAVEWIWTSPGGLARRSGKVIYPNGEPIDFQFHEGRLLLKVEVQATADHPILQRSYSLNLDTPGIQETNFTLEIPRKLEVTLIDQFTFVPLAGASVSTPEGRAYTDDQGKAIIKNLKKGSQIYINALSGDQNFYGAGFTTIGNDLVTRLTIPMNPNIGDAEFQFTQRGLPFNRGLLQLTGNGAFYAQLLNGQSTLFFRKLIQGTYSYKLLDPLSGIQLTGSISVTPEQTVTKVIDVPGTAPFTFVGTYQGGYDIPIGQKFQLKTPLRNFTAEMKEDDSGNRLVDFGFIPEGTWKISTPNIPTYQWNPQIAIAFGIFNRYEAFDSLSLPYWSTVIFRVADYNGLPIKKFQAKLYKTNSSTYEVQANGYNGLLTLNLSPGGRYVDIDIANSPYLLRGNYIYAGAPGEGISPEAGNILDVSLPEPTGSVTFAARDFEGRFLTTSVLASMIDFPPNANPESNSTGYYLGEFGTQNATPFVTFDYLPLNARYRFLVSYQNQVKVPFDKQVTLPYQEFDDIILDIVPPEATWEVVWDQNRAFTLEVRTNKPVDSVWLRRSYNYPLTYDSSKDAWVITVPNLKNPWTLGANTIDITVKGISGITSTYRDTITWNSTHELMISPETTITGLPASIDITFADPSIQVDPTRFTNVPSSISPHVLKVSNTTQTVEPTPDGRGVRHVLSLLQAPWRLGNNTINTLVFDSEGNPSEASFQLETDLPAIGAVTIRNLRYNSLDTAIDVTLTAQAPDGTRTTYPLSGVNEWSLTDMAYGRWIFFLENHHANGPYLSIIDTEINTPTVQIQSTVYLPMTTQTVTLLDSDGNPSANQTLNLSHVYSSSVTLGEERPILWNVGTITTDENGQFTYQRFTTTRWYVWVQWDRGTYTFEDILRTGLTTIQDYGVGDIRISAIDALTQYQPIPGLEIFIDDLLVGQTDSQGEWISGQDFQANQYFELRISGTTPDGGLVDYTDYPQTVPNRLNVELEFEPYYEGVLELLPQVPVSPLVAEMRVGDQRFFAPFNQTIALTLQEGNYLIRAMDANGRDWYSGYVFVARNITTYFDIVDPDPTSLTQTLVTVRDAANAVVSGARVIVDGNELGVTDGSGQFSFTSIAGDHDLAAVNTTGYGSLPFTSETGMAVELEVVLNSFTPSSLSHNIVWLTADRATLQRQPDDQVSAWVNLAPLAQHARQQDLALQPRYGAQALAGMPALTFTYTREGYLDLGSGFEDMSLGFTAFVVARNQPMDRGGRYRTGAIFGFQTSSPSTSTYGFVGNNDGQHAYFNGLAIGNGLRSYEPVALGSTQQGTVLKVYRNGVETGQATRTALGVVTRNLNQIGKRFGGQIAEIIAYNRTLSDSERDQVSLYLAEKYGLYHPQAAWVSALPVEAQAYVAQRQLNREQGERYATFIAENPALPAEGLRLWLDAGQGVQQENGRLTNWEDQSFFRQNASLVRDEVNPLPLTVATAAPGNLPSVHFSGGTALEYLDLAPTLNRDNTVIAVLKAETPPPNYLLQLMGGSQIDTTSSEYFQRLDRDGYLELAGTDSNTISLFESWNMATSQLISPTTGNVRINGFQSPNNTFSENSRNERFWLGSTVQDPSNGFFAPFIGDIAEVLIYENALSEESLQKVEGYLAGKYGITYDLKAPTISPPGGVYTSEQTVTLSSFFPNAVIYYTTDGSEPSEQSASVVSGESVLITSDTVLRARVILPGMAPGTIQSEHYIVGPLGPETVVITANQFIYAAGTTSQDYEGKDLIIDRATVDVLGPHQFNSLRLINGAVLTHAANDIGGLNLQITQNLEIDLTSAIDANGKGHKPGEGLGRGLSGAGGSHGGKGGTTSSNATVRATYGNKFEPTNLGSGGGGYGGGYVKLVIGGNLQLEGRISANGAKGTSSTSTSGGGAGGSIYIVTNTLTQTGIIQADGGPGVVDGPANDQGGGGGGGGRVALGFDEALSIIDPSKISARENLGRFAEYGSVVLNGVEVDPDFEFGIYFLKVSHPGSFYQARLDHADGRSYVRDLQDRQVTYFPEVSRGETWSISWSDGTQWFPFSEVTTGRYTSEIRQIQICDNVKLTFQLEREIRNYTYSWKVNGVPVEVEPDPITGITFYRFNLTPGATTHRIEGFLEGFAAPVLVYENYLRCGTSYTIIRNDIDWSRSQILRRAADGITGISPNNALLVEATIVDKVSGAEFSLGTRNSNGILNLSEFKAPTDGSVTLRYRYDYETVGELLSEGQVDFGGFVSGSRSFWEIPLPYAVWNGGFELSDGSAIHNFKRLQMELPDGNNDSLNFEAQNRTFKIVRSVPNDRRFSLNYQIDFLEDTVVDYETSSLVSNEILRTPPHSELLVPQNSIADFITVYGGKNLSTFSWPGASQYYIEDFPTRTGVSPQDTETGPYPFYFSPGTYWSASAGNFATEHGYFANAGESYTLPWADPNIPFETGYLDIDFSGLDSFFGVDGTEPEVEHRYGLMAFTEKTGAFPIGQGECMSYYEPYCSIQLPKETKVWFVFFTEKTYFFPDIGGGGEAEKASHKAASGQQAWVIEYDLTPADFDTGIQLTPAHLGVQTFTWDATHEVAVFPSVLAHLLDNPFGSPSQYYDYTFTWGGDLQDHPYQVLYNPLGWFATTSVFTSADETKLAWRTRFEQFNDSLANQTLSLPVYFQSEVGQDLGGATILPGSNYMFGLLTGLPGALSQPFTTPVLEIDQGGGEGGPIVGLYHFTVEIPVPETPPPTMDFVFPMWLEAYDPGMSTEAFENFFIDWRDTFDPATDPFWLSLPLEWQNALNWVLP